MGSEKRQHPRFTLDPNTGTLTAPGGYRHLCRVRNISASGLMLELSLLDEATDFEVGDLISIETPPDRLEEMLKDARGEIVWVRGDLLGVRFTKEPPQDSPLLRNPLS
ncbi:MAG: PilZ domain-containing protein [Desulfovibrionaceae bacterium]|jgi:hypothetical protein